MLGGNLYTHTTKHFCTCLEHPMTKCFSRIFCPSPIVYLLQPRSPNPLEKQYPNLQLYCPSVVKGQNRKSSVWLRASGIFFASSASAGRRTPSNISASQFPVVSSIKQSTVASSIDSMIREVTNGGCLMGSQWFCHI